MKKNIFKNFSQNSQKITSVGVSFFKKLEPETCYFVKIQTQTWVFFYEFCKFSKNIFFIEHL